MKWVTQKQKCKRKEVSPGLLPPLPAAFAHALSSVRSQQFQVRRLFWNITKFGHRQR